MKNSVLFLAVFIIFGFLANAQTDRVSGKDAIASVENMSIPNVGEKNIESAIIGNKSNESKLGKNEATYQSRKQFLQNFGNLKVTKTKRAKNLDVITFLNKEGAAVNAYYDNESNLIGTATAKIFENLPANAQVSIKEKYSDYTIAEIIFFDYSGQFSDADNYFVLLDKANEKKIVLKVDQEGHVNLYKTIK